MFNTTFIGYITQAEMVRYLGVSLRAAGGIIDVEAAVRDSTANVIMTYMHLYKTKRQ